MMAAAEQQRFIHLSRPLGPGTFGYSAGNAQLSVTIQLQAIFSILDHANRRDDRDTQSTRVIGALVGVRSEDGTELDVRSCFAIPHTENEDQVEVDVEYQKNMLALTRKASPHEVLLGWYTTSAELNSFSALIQNFFASPETGTFPHPAVHLTISTTPGQVPTTRTYTSAPVGVNAERAADSCLFIEVPHRVATGGDAERSALEAIAAAKDVESRAAPVATDIQALAASLGGLTDLLGRTSDYINDVLDEEHDGSETLGQLLMKELSLAPRVDSASIEMDFNNHIQDVLMVSYLANTIRTQIDLAQRLATAALTGDKDAADKAKDGQDGARGEAAGGGGRGGRGGKRGGRGGGRGGGGLNREPREPREPME